MSAAAALRLLVEQRFPNAPGIATGADLRLSTGIEVLDRALPRGGFPRSQLSIWKPTGGATALLRTIALNASIRGESCVWLDTGFSMTGVDSFDGVNFLRPKGRREALKGGEMLLKSGGFALVVFTGFDPQPGESQRLLHAAREGKSALVMVTPRTPLASLRLASRIDPADYRWSETPFGEPGVAQAVSARVRAQGTAWHAECRISLSVAHYDPQTALATGLPDRRGIKRKSGTRRHRRVEHVAPAGS